MRVRKSLAGTSWCSSINLIRKSSSPRKWTKRSLALRDESRGIVDVFVISPSLSLPLSLNHSLSLPLSLSLSLPLSVRLLSIRDRFLFFAVKRICWHESMSTYFSLSSCACLFLCLGDTCLCLGSPFPSLCEYIYMSPTALVRTVTCKWQRKYYCCQRVTRAFVFVLTRECCNFNTWLVIF